MTTAAFDLTPARLHLPARPAHKPDLERRLASLNYEIATYSARTFDATRRRIVRDLHAIADDTGGVGPGGDARVQALHERARALGILPAAGAAPLRLFECRVIAGGRVARTARVLARDTIEAGQAFGPVGSGTEHRIVEVRS